MLTTALAWPSRTGCGWGGPGYACLWQNSNHTGYRPPGLLLLRQAGGAWMVGEDWVSSGGSSQLEWIFGGPGGYALAQLDGADYRADVIRLYA